MCKQRQLPTYLAAGLLLTFASVASAQVFVDPNAPDSPNDGSSWRNALLTLQDALDPSVAVPGTEIWVANGTYIPTARYCVDCADPNSDARRATFRIGLGVAVYGGFAGSDPLDPNSVGETSLDQRDELVNVAILSGDVNQDGYFFRSEDVYHVVTVHNADDDLERTKLSGFTIEYGNADAAPSAAIVQYERIGGGILVAGTRESGIDIQSSIRVTRCVIDECRAELRAAGMAVTWTAIPDPNDVLPVRAVNCTFIHNVLNSDPNDPSATQLGAGLAVMGAAFELTNNVFWENAGGNFGGGVSIEDWIDPNLLPVESAGAITNCTFNANKHAIFASTATDIPVRNTICWGNQAGADPNSDLDNEVGGTLVVSFSDIQRDATFIFPGIGNINDDPNFCSTSPSVNIHEFLLMVNENSPVVDLGNDPNVPADTADVDDDGNIAETIEWDRGKRQRQFDSVAGGDIVDMGAYEVRRVDSCREDINRDGIVNLTDLALLLQVFGTNFGTCPFHPADVSRNGTVDLTDLAMLLAQFGCSCSSPCPTMLVGGGGSGEPNAVWTEQTSETPTPEFVEWARQASLEDLFEWRAWYSGGGQTH